MRYLDLVEGIKVFHGSRSGHSRFKIGHVGQNSHTFGDYNSKRYGVFFTNNPKVASIYGEVDQYELHVSNNEIANLDKNIINDFLGYLGDSLPELYKGARELHHTWQFFEDEIGEVFYKWLVENGYKAATFIEYINDEDGEEHESQTYVLLDLNVVRRNPDPAQPDLFLK